MDQQAMRDRRTAEIGYVVVTSAVVLGIVGLGYEFAVRHLDQVWRARAATWAPVGLVVLVGLLLVRAVRVLRRFEADLGDVHVR